MTLTLETQTKNTNILDPVEECLDKRVFDDACAPEPKLKEVHAKWITNTVISTLKKNGYTHMEDWLTLILTGSLTTYQYSDESDVDISLFVDTTRFPEWSRAEMIGVMVENVDGKTLPGTPHPMQCFVVPPGIAPQDLYKPGLRSGWDIKNKFWIIPPEKSRVHNVESEMNSAYTYALESADKMERLLKYEPDKAVMFWSQIHKRRQRDQRAGKGDYSDSNIVYKFLANRGLFPLISELTHEYIAGLRPAENWNFSSIAKTIAKTAMDEDAGDGKVYFDPAYSRYHNAMRAAGLKPSELDNANWQLSSISAIISSDEEIDSTRQEAFSESLRGSVAQKLAQGDEEAQIEFPSLPEAQEIHDQALEEYGQQPAPLLHPARLESALGRAANHWYYGQGSDAERIANAAGALAHGIGAAQAFEDGNKRTAYHTSRYFLHNNGYDQVSPVTGDDEELADHLIGHGEGTHTLEDTQGLFRSRLGHIAKTAAEDWWGRAPAFSGEVQVQNGGHEIRNPRHEGPFVSEPWEPGSFGKGIHVVNNGQATFHTWETDEGRGSPHHTQIIAPMRTFDWQGTPVDQLEMGPGYEINPDGSVQGPYHHPQWDALVPHPFRPITTEPNWNFSKVAALPVIVHPSKGVFIGNENEYHHDLSQRNDLADGMDAQDWDNTVATGLIYPQGPHVEWYNHIPTPEAQQEVNRQMGNEYTHSHDDFNQWIENKQNPWHLGAIAPYFVDHRAVEMARQHMGLQQPVQVIPVGGTSGGYAMPDDSGTHQIQVVNWLRPEAASRQIWHELAHAKQYESDPNGFKAGLNEYDQIRSRGHDGYAMHPWELEANQTALQHPFPLALPSSNIQNTSPVHQRDDPKSNPLEDYPD